MSAAVSAAQAVRAQFLGDVIRDKEHLKEIIAKLLDLAELFGLSGEWVQRLQAVLVDSQLLDIVWAIYEMFFTSANASAQVSGNHIAVSISRGDAREASGESIQLNPSDLMEWLPLIIKLVDLLKSIRR